MVLAAGGSFQWFRNQLGRAEVDAARIRGVDPYVLLTDEAAGVYFRALASDGVLLIHVSNRFVDLEPVLAALARERGLAAAARAGVRPAGRAPATFHRRGRPPRSG